MNEDEKTKKKGLLSSFTSGDFKERAENAALAQGITSQIQTGIDPNGVSPVLSAAGGGTSGALLGAAVTANPAGAIIGGTLGALSGILGANRRKNQAQAQAQAQSAQIMANAQRDIASQLQSQNFSFGRGRGGYRNNG